MIRAPSHAWWHTLSRLAAWLAVCTLAGAALGSAPGGLTFGLAAALGRQYLRLHRLLADLGGRRRLPAPDGWDLLAEIRMQLYRRQREARRRRQRLQALLTAFRTAAEAMPDGILVLSRRELQIEWFNRAAAGLLGLQKRDIGTRFRNLLRAPRVADWLAAGAAEPLFDLPAPNDPARRLQLRLIDYTAQQQLLIVRDISKLLQLEQVRRDFVANVSHELRTPLTVIHGYLDMIDPSEHQELAPLIVEMQRQSGRMTQLVEDLLTLSRLDAADHLELEPVPMAPLLASLLAEANALSGGRHRIALVDSAAVDLLGSARELHSAFSNLVANAVRYTPADGEIRIEFAANDDGGARLAVVDSGPGIPAQHLPRLTERFYRVSASRARDRGGTGLGLAIVKHVMQLHHGRLEIASEIGVGSRFACVFDRDQVLPRAGEPVRS